MDEFFDALYEAEVAEIDQHFVGRDWSYSDEEGSIYFRAHATHKDGTSTEWRFDEKDLKDAQYVNDSWLLMPGSMNPVMVRLYRLEEITDD